MTGSRTAEASTAPLCHYRELHNGTVLYCTEVNSVQCSKVALTPGGTKARLNAMENILKCIHNSQGGDIYILLIYLIFIFLPPYLVCHKGGVEADQS